MTDRLRKTVHLGAALDPATLFGQRPDGSRQRCRDAYRAGRNDARDALDAAGYGTRRDEPATDEVPGRGTPEWETWWERWYAGHRDAQQMARQRLAQYEPEMEEAA